MKIAFRVDASLEIGTGHVMRCLTLADALRAKGAECFFICRWHIGNLLKVIHQRGYAVHALPLSEHQIKKESPLDESPKIKAGLTYAAWIGADWASDARQTQTALGEVPVDWLIVDHYALDDRWELVLRGSCNKLLAIDDLANRRHACDVLLDQNLGRITKDYFGLLPVHCTVLVGPEYALLRPEFAALRSYSLARRFNPRLQRLLIAMGGVDKDNITGKVLGALRDYPFASDSHITVVMGPHAPWLEAVQAKSVELPWPVKVLVNVEDMAKLMAEQDLAIGAAGTTAWERCCLGLPALTMVLADNQLNNAIALEATGAVLVLANHDRLESDLKEKLDLLANPERLKAMQLSGSSLTDGCGATRLVKLLVASNE